MEKKKVIAAGHICLDITPMFPDRKVQHPGELLSPGKLLEVGAADVHTGGSVANTGLAMKKLGADVSLMGKVGKDAFGNMILDILKKHDADTDMLIEEGEETSYSVVLAIPGLTVSFCIMRGLTVILRRRIFRRKSWKKLHCSTLVTHR